ncbi:DUF4347 domain-containing protein [Flagellimonas sp.]|uniref:DUF4347 domain-containing protein n=1 Tax=Flagellimonas sp. TaxID=2058762 RepID=UPI003BB1FDBE
MKKNHPTKNHVLRCFTLLCTALITLNLSAQNSEIVIIDENFPNKNGLIASLPVDVKLIEANSQSSLQQTLETAVKAGTSIQNIHLFCNTDNSIITLGNQQYSTDNIVSNLDKMAFSGHTPKNLLVYSCTLAKHAEGIALLEAIADETNLNVASCFSCETIDEELEFNFSTSPTLITSSLFK